MLEHTAKPRSGLGAFAKWPDELICYFLHRVDVPELLRLSQTSKLMRVFVCEEPLWLQKHLERCARAFAYRGSWRATYMAYHPACGRPELDAADLVPPAPVEGFASDVLYRRWYRCHVDLAHFLPPEHAANGGSDSTCCNGSGSHPDSILIVPNAAVMTAAEFEERCDRPGRPALLGGLTADWAGGSLDAWQPARLAAEFGGRLFKVSKPFLAGGRTRMRLGDYLAYAGQQRDEEPLYIFDATFGETAPELLERYRVPHLFGHDLFACLAPRREDFRWLVVGPARSGASWHVDPSATSAWNTLLSGRKRWALYPPGRVPPGVEVAIDSEGSPAFETPTSLQWFLEVYPKLAPPERPLELVQRPGETVFVPAGWWHCVLNLDMTVAVTQNFVSPANLAAAVRWQVLGAGSLFDPHLGDAYLAQRRLQQGPQQEQEQEPEQEEEQARQRAKRRAASDGAAAARRKRRRRAGGGGPGADERAEAAAVAAEAAAVEAEAREAAAAHLAELELGFRRDSQLCPWLRGLLQQGTAAAVGQVPGGTSGTSEPALQDHVWQLVQQWTDVPAWRPRLAAACAAAGLPPPRCRHEWLPLATGWCVVFEVGDAILKFFPPDAPHATAMGCMEAAAYLALAAADSRSQGPAGGASRGSSGASRLLHAGLLDGGGAACAGGQEGAPGPGSVGTVPTPFLVLEKAPGQVLSTCIDGLSEQQLLAVAAAAGRSLAALHAAPLPLAAAGCSHSGNAERRACTCASAERNCEERSGAAAAHVAVQPRYSTAWVVRDGTVCSSTLGTLDLRRGEAGRKLQAPGLDELAQRQRLVLRSLFPGVAATLLGTADGPVVAEVAIGSHAAAADEAGAACRRCAAWQPFAAFLRRQRGEMAATHRAEGSLPPHLLDQLESYLPVDPAALLGCPCLLRGGAGDCQPAQASGTVHGGGAAAASPAPPDGCSSGSIGGASGGGLPTWVHGDLTVGNLLVRGLPQQPEQAQAQQAAALPGEGQQPAATPGEEQRQAAVRVSLIDFADGGHGDGLWDFVVLLLRTLRCHRGAAAAALAAYAAAAPPAWPARPPGVSLAYVAMCYTLLHELMPVHDLLKRQPELWEAGSLEEVAAAAWGWLDGAVAGCPQAP